MRSRAYLRSLRSVSLWRWLLAVAIFLFGLVAISVDLNYPPIWVINVQGPDGVELTQPRAFAPLVAKLSALLTAALAGSAQIAKGMRVSTAELQVDRRDIVDRLQEQTRVFFVQLADLVIEGLKCEDKQKAVWQEMTVRLYVVDDAGEQPILSSIAKVWHHNRQSSDQTWKKGVGCVGLAWATGDATRLWGSRPERLRALSSPREWENAPEEMTQGLTHSEAARLQKLGFGAVLAHPIRVSGEVRAVVAIDFREDGYYRALCMNDTIQPAVDRYINLAVFDLEALREVNFV